MGFPAAGTYVPVKVADEWEVRLAIITREARDASGDMHDRMPAFLSSDPWDAWLSPAELEDPAEAVDMLMATSETVASTITTYPVSSAINNVRARELGDDPSLLEPVDVWLVSSLFKDPQAALTAASLSLRFRVRGGTFAKP